MDSSQIRNFSIIAHIDHGKSTLADRMLEITKTIDPRKMQDQVLDNMELEKERGITIKMTPVRMHHEHAGKKYQLNLIDTPGHIDFSYEVSRALTAVEGCILLVDATQGVQAQTLSVLEMAQKLGRVIIPVLSKIDAPAARPQDVIEELVDIIHVDPDHVLMVSGKTGEGVSELLQAVIERVPPPEAGSKDPKDARALIFDFAYSNHQGVIVYSRLFDGTIRPGDTCVFASSAAQFVVNEVGVFAPDRVKTTELSAGQIGYIVTGVKEPGVASVGDTITSKENRKEALSGFERPRPVVWASMYPESQDDFTELTHALSRLRLSDSSLVFEEETSGILGRGYRCGLLGMLHLEIVTERLRREYGLNLVVTNPSIVYRVHLKNGKEEIVYSPHLFPDEGVIEKIFEPWTRISIIMPNTYLGGLTTLLYEHEAELHDVETLSHDRSKLVADMPLRELMRNFFDELKSVTSGYASLSYEPLPEREALVTRLDILVADEVVPAFTRVVSKARAYEDAEKAVEKLHELLPRQMFVTKIQGRALGRILSSATLQAFRKDVTQHMYGGDITRKMKLREKQKKGKAKMKERGSVNIPPDVFLKMVKQ